MKSAIGIIGLGVMGASLAQNFANKKIQVSAYNHHKDKVDALVKKANSPYLVGHDILKKFVTSLEAPRKIVLMVPAGDPVDETIKNLRPLLSKGDIITDGGNSFFRDTLRRTEELNKKSIHFVGMGISGGEKGALEGPCIMPGTSKAVWKSLKPLLEKIAAKDFSEKPCVVNVGASGAGHYVKMVHNGIEYALMQLIAESYGLLKGLYGLSNDNIATVFESFNDTRLGSYLMEISVTVFQKKEGTKGLIDLILDVSGNKGTGKWTSQEALELGIALPIITESLFARYVSSEKNLRVLLGKKINKSSKSESADLPPRDYSAELPPRDYSTELPPLTVFLEMLESALYGAFLLAYAEGFMMLDRANTAYKFDLDFREVARIWQGGCIIRAKMLKDIAKALPRKSGMLLTDKKYLKEIISCMESLKNITITGAITETPTAAFSAALNGFYGMTSTQLPSNLIQGLRDLFGAHTYQRVDKKGIFHTQWE